MAQDKKAVRQARGAGLKSKTGVRRSRVRRAKGLTLGEFGSLSSAEKQLLAACGAGEIAEISELDWNDDEGIDELRDNEDYHVRGDFIRFLSLGGDDRAPIASQGIQLSHAYIDGDVDLDGATVRYPLSFTNCAMSGAFWLSDATMRSLYITTPGLTEW